MTEELKKIDRSAIEDLVKIREEEDVLKERLAKMEASRANVSSVVYERVNADYRTRLETLERNARPLRDVARREYAKLKNLDEQYRKSMQDVSLEKEEIEFRQQLGEFTEDDFRSRIAEFDSRLAEHQGRIDSASQMKADFLRAFASIADLEAAPAAVATPRVSQSGAAPAAATPPVATPAASSPGGAHSAPPASTGAAASAPNSAAPSAQPVTTPMNLPPQPERAAPAATPPPAPPQAQAAPAPARSTPEPAPAAPAPSAAAAAVLGAGVPEKMAAAGVHDDATVVGPQSAMEIPQIAAVPPPNVSPKTTERGGATVVFSMPKLVAILNGAPAEEYVLSAKTSIGRTSKNDIQVLEDSVSRSHCEVVLATDGYKVVDLGSHNGISVNGEKVRERILADGDILQIGTRQFLFRA
jgi:hypothetical protein